MYETLCGNHIISLSLSLSLFLAFVPVVLAVRTDIQL